VVYATSHRGKGTASCGKDPVYHPQNLPAQHPRKKAEDCSTDNKKVHFTDTNTVTVGILLERIRLKTIKILLSSVLLTNNHHHHHHYSACIIGA